MQFDQNGYHFSDEQSAVENLNFWIEKKNLRGYRAFYVTKNEYKSFVLYDDQGNPCYESFDVESMAVHIDILVMVEK